MASCPKCNSPIRLRALLFSIVPVWISCSKCHTPLEGDYFVRFQTVLVAVLSFLGGAGLVAAVSSYDLGISDVTLFLICGALGITVPNAFISLKLGRFTERE